MNLSEAMETNKLAYDFAKSIIECSCEAHSIWYDLASADGDTPTVERAARYLELRGLLRRKVGQPSFVKVRRA